MLDFDPFAYFCMEQWHNKQIHSNENRDYHRYCKNRNILAYTKDKKCFS